MHKADHTSPAPLLTKQDIARLAQVSIRTIEHWLKAGRLSKMKFGRTVRIAPDEFERFMAVHTLHASSIAGRH